MTILITMTSALIVITAYSLGVWTGSRFYCPDGGKGHLLRKSGGTGRDGKLGMDGGTMSGSCLEPVKLRKHPLRGNTGSAVADFCNTESVGNTAEAIMETVNHKRAAAGFSDAERQQQSAYALTDAEQQSQFFRYLTDAERQQRSADVLTDAEKQKRFEEDLKAFQDCMNYCQEKAYGVET